MKKIYFLFLLLIASTTTFAQGNEDFTNSAATGTYADGSFVGNDGINWSYTHSRDESTYPIDGKGLMLRRADDPSSISATISGGIGDFSVNTRKAFTGNTQRRIELVVNGAVVAQFEPTYGVGGDATVVPFVVNGVNVPGDVTVTLRLYGANGNQQMTIDDIVWTGFTGTATPSLSITSPTEGEEIAPGADTLLEFSVLNFDVASSGGDGYVNYTIDGGANNSVFTTDPVNLGVLTAGAHVLFVELVDDLGNSLTPAVTQTVNFTVADVTSVADITALRADVELNGVGSFYTITGASLVTHTDGFNNRHWIQDSNISGILIFDNSNIIDTPYNVGDNVTGLTGYTTLASGVLRFIPTSNSGVVASSGNAVTPQVVTIAALNATPDDYESELVRINNVTFTAGDGVATFATGQNYDVTDGTDTIIKRTDFFGADYIGELIPSGALPGIIAVAGEFNGTAQIYVRNLSDLTLSTPSFETLRFSVYPNPVSNGFVTINTTNADPINILVYDVLGKQVKNETITNNTLNVGDLNTGIYILKMTQNQATATKKLIIK